MTVQHKIISSVDDPLARAGQILGISDWFRVSQDLINQFGEVTGDQQWIHVSPVLASSGPFGTCIAHGLLTLSLAGGRFFHELVKTQAKSGINYGCDRVRYPAPLHVEKLIRAKAEVLESCKLESETLQLKIRMTVEVENEPRPVCVADFVVRYLF